MAIVYILTNAAMPGLVKIGCTEKSIEDRMRELSAASGVPVAFECFLAIQVDDHRAIEQAMHEAFGDRRLNPRREFFELAPGRPAAILKMFQTSNAKEVTPQEDVVESPEEQRALDKERTRRANFRFSQVGLQPGAVLISTIDNTATCIVADDRLVEFRDERTSLSDAAMRISRANGRRSTALQGPLYWSYEGRTLVEMRDEIENI